MVSSSLAGMRWPDFGWFAQCLGESLSILTHLDGQASVGFYRSQAHHSKKGDVLNRPRGELPCSSREFWSSNGYPG